ncbi:MAG: hypothetical protein PHR56_07730 [Dehalococcoidales bacterium]|nr:hypothetical protein [Dehalococcoidales bacterium]
MEIDLGFKIGALLFCVILFALAIFHQTIGDWFGSIVKSIFRRK